MNIYVSTTCTSFGIGIQNWNSRAFKKLRINKFLLFTLELLDHDLFLRFYRAASR
jgi:hypothetical protein